MKACVTSSSDPAKQEKFLAYMAPNPNEVYTFYMKFQISFLLISIAVLKHYYFSSIFITGLFICHLLF